MKMIKMNIKEIVLKNKFLFTLLILDLIFFIMENFVYLLGNFFLLITTFFIFGFLIFITATYILVLFEKYNRIIFILGIALFIFGFIEAIFTPKPNGILGTNVSSFQLMLGPILVIISLFILPQSFLLLILKHFAIFEKQNTIIKTIIINGIILILPFILSLILLLI